MWSPEANHMRYITDNEGINKMKLILHALVLIMIMTHSTQSAAFDVQDHEGYVSIVSPDNEQLDVFKITLVSASGLPIVTGCGRGQFIVLSPSKEVAQRKYALAITAVISGHAVNIREIKNKCLNEFNKRGNNTSTDKYPYREAKDFRLLK